MAVRFKQPVNEPIHKKENIIRPAYEIESTPVKYDITIITVSAHSGDAIPSVRVAVWLQSNIKGDLSSDVLSKTMLGGVSDERGVVTINDVESGEELFIRARCAHGDQWYRTSEIYYTVQDGSKVVIHMVPDLYLAPTKPVPPPNRLVRY